MMGKITAPSKVKLFVGMLSQDVTLFGQITDRLSRVFGPCDLESPVWPWDHTTYYQKEMGPELKRKFIFFEEPVGPGDIADIKLHTVKLEGGYLNEKGGRRINLDPGYLDSAKVVLVSTKDFSHRIYLDRGIYGEVTLIYSGGDYQILPYTFPDFRTAEYMEIFRAARVLYRKRMKASSGQTLQRDTGRRL